jgi:hypothetical protein
MLAVARPAPPLVVLAVLRRRRPSAIAVLVGGWRAR